MTDFNIAPVIFCILRGTRKGTKPEPERLNIKHMNKAVMDKRAFA